MAKESLVKNKYYQYFPLRFLTERLIRKITERTINAFDGFIQEGEEVLDIGAGAGWIAQGLQKRKGAIMTLLDVIKFNQTNLPFFLYDGKNMPFPENNFDTVLLICVLHHCDDPQQVLKEAKRVTRDKIIIIEDIPTFWFNRILLCLRDVINNLAFCFLVRGMKEITNLPFHFKKISEWEEVLGNLNIEIIYKKKIRSLAGTQNAVFVVQKNSK